jgi:hypothetical protein
MDLVQQVATAFFGLKNLLNAQPGGFNMIYSPGEKSFKAYRLLEQDFFSIYQEFSNQATELGETDALKTTWLHKISTQIDTNTVDDNEKSVLLNVVLNQEIPKHTVNGHHLLLVIGSDVSHHSFIKGIPYLNPLSSRSGFIFCDNTYLKTKRLEAWRK